MTNYLYPDMFPYVDVNAPSGLETLQNWQLNGNEIRFNTLFANQGDGLFEIRRGPDVDLDDHLLIQRVYIDQDFGPEYEDFVIGTAPIPGTPDNPNPDVPFPTDDRVLWFEDFTTFSLHEAVVADGAVTVGEELASDTKTSWRLSANRGPLPGFGSPPSYGSSDQRLEQRISVGWADLYGAGSSGQFVDITGVPAGPLYWLRQTVDPENRIMETDETNNSFEILIDLNNPGEAITFAGEFVRPGDALPPADGDLNQDGVVNLDDWLAFQAGANTDLEGLSGTDAYALGDLNLDGQHSLQDAVLFRQFYDQANGAGAFAAIQNTPGAGVDRGARRVRRPTVRRQPTHGPRGAPHAVGSGRPDGGRHRHGRADRERPGDAFRGRLRRDFRFKTPNRHRSSLGPTFGPTRRRADGLVTTGRRPPMAPSSSSAGPSLTRSWWISTAGDQNRSQFNGASGTVAVVDPDEYDDLGDIDPNRFTASLTTPPIDISGAEPGGAILQFDSSWRWEDTQTAAVFASIDGGAPVEVYRWSSNTGSQNFKPDATNEIVSIGASVAASGQNNYAFNINPAGASTLQLTFDMPAAGNDWWWAVDNIRVFAPSTLFVNLDTGRMTISGGDGVTGYEITSESGSLEPAGWVLENLDAKNLGSPTPLTADFDNDATVAASDYAVWRENLGAGPAGDANGDLIADQQDFDAWVEQYGASVAAGGSWETLIANDDQLLEFFLGGASDLPSTSIGQSYDTSKDGQDLRFVYSLEDGTTVEGAVVYQSGPTPRIETSGVPEPATSLTYIIAVGIAASCRPMRQPA